MGSLIYCEVRKIVKSVLFWVVLAMFTVLPSMSLIKYAVSANVSWSAYLDDILSTFSAVLIIGFAFTTSWAFGREYTDRTIDDLLVKPVSKLRVATAKFCALTLWNVLLTAAMYTVVVLIGSKVGLSGFAASTLLKYLGMFMAVALMTMLVSTVSAFLANLTKGYLAPIGVIFIIVIIMNVVMNVGLSTYIPWTIPGLLLSEGYLHPISIAILAVTGGAGYAGTVAWWRYRQQH